MADPSGGQVPQAIAATGTAVAAVIGALVLWPTRRRRARAAENMDDPDLRPAKLAQRLSVVETLVGTHKERLDHLGEEVMLLRAQEITAEGLTPRPRRRRQAREDD